MTLASAVPVFAEYFLSNSAWLIPEKISSTSIGADVSTASLLLIMLPPPAAPAPAAVPFPLAGFAAVAAIEACVVALPAGRTLAVIVMGPPAADDLSEAAAVGIRAAVGSLSVPSGSGSESISTAAASPLSPTAAVAALTLSVAAGVTGSLITLAAGAVGALAVAAVAAAGEAAAVALPALATGAAASSGVARAALGESMEANAALGTMAIGAAAA